MSRAIPHPEPGWVLTKLLGSLSLPTHAFPLSSTLYLPLCCEELCLPSDQLELFVLLIYLHFSFMHMSVLLARLCTHVQCLWRPEVGVGSPGTGITDSCELSCGSWD